MKCSILVNRHNEKSRRETQKQEDEKARADAIAETERRASLNPHDLMIENITEPLKNPSVNAKRAGHNENVALITQLFTALQSVIDSNWSAQDKINLEKATKQHTKFITGNKEKELKALYRQLRGE